MPNYTAATTEVVDMVDKLIEAYHPALSDASIGLLFREEAPNQAGKTVFGKAKKLPDDMRAFLDMDFVIWVAQDVWEQIDSRQRRALLDHELCHLHVTDDGKLQIRPHDVEEFTDIIERWGFWWPGAGEYQQAVQGALGLDVERIGAVQAVGEDVLEQVGSVFE